MIRADRSILLLHPPYGDVTQPYHALSYVAAPLRAAGFDVEVLDINALWFRGVFTSEAVSRLRDELSEAFAALQRRSTWEPDDQAEACRLVRAIVACDRLRPEEAAAVFRSERFYDYESYAWAQQQVREFERVLDRAYAPYDFSTAFSQPVYVPSCRGLVDDARRSGRWVSDMASLLREHCGREHYLMCGVSVPFTMHLLPALALMAAVEHVFPGTPRVLGGTAATDLVKCSAEPASLGPLGEFCDLIYTGEAEVGAAALARWIGGEAVEMPEQARPVSARYAATGAANPVGPRRYVALSTPGRGGGHQPYDWRQSPPLYDWIDWSLYLSPRRQVNYSPARGCFWNRCTFCDYGLNDGSPTAPARVMDAKTVVDHLAALAAHGVEHVYFAVDAIPPGFLRELAGEIIARGLRLRWSTELFLTPRFDEAAWDLLHRSGLVTASFGLESGSSRVLEAMGKGEARVESVLRPVLAAARRSPVGLQPKYFYGFPGETDEDRQQTIDLLLDHRDVFSVLTKANVFDLTAGAAVAREPQRFGVRNIRRRPGDDIGGGLDYDLTDGSPTPGPGDFRQFNAQVEYPPCFERPWAGGIDTLHTKLYIERFGRGVFHELLTGGRAHAAHRQPWSRFTALSRFDLEDVMSNVQLARCAATPCARRAARQALGDEAAAALSAADAAVFPQPVASQYDIYLR